MISGTQLKNFDSDLEVVICDGYEAITYHTNDMGFKEFKEYDETIVLDIGIGENRI